MQSFSGILIKMLGEWRAFNFLSIFVKFPTNCSTRSVKVVVVPKDVMIGLICYHPTSEYTDQE